MTEPSLFQSLESRSYWELLIEAFRERNTRKHRKHRAFAALLESGELMPAIEALQHAAYRHSPPEQHQINRHGQSKKKTVYTQRAIDELLCKGVNRILGGVVSRYLSPNCHSFRPGMGARSAFARILRDNRLSQKYCLKLDISNFFNSINVEDFLATLPAALCEDELLYSFLKGLLRQSAVCRQGRLIDEPNKGLMAGTPLAPLLSNLYLRELDAHFLKLGVNYARYCDDIILFDDAYHLAGHERHIRDRLAEKGLAVNEQKSRIIDAGGGWDFLGLHYEGGVIDLSPHTLYKFRGKLRRLANRYDRLRERKGLDGHCAVQWFLKRLNRKFYGIGHDSGDLCWSRWFFPLITTSATLSRIDALVQQKIRFVASGLHSKRSYKAISYDQMKELGYLPLVAAYHLYRKDTVKYFQLIDNKFSANSNENIE